MGFRRIGRRSIESKASLNIPVLGHPDHERYGPYCEWQVLHLLSSLQLLDGVLDPEAEGSVAIEQVLGVAARLADIESLGAAAAREALLKQLRSRYEQLRLQPPPLPADTHLARNLRTLQAALGLQPVEVELLHWRCLIELHPALQDTSNAIGGLSGLQTLHVLALALGQPVELLRDVLSPEGKLAQAGLLELELDHRQELSSKLDLKDSFAEQLLLSRADQGPGDALELFRHQFARAAAPTLRAQHYAHLEDQLQLLSNLLSAALRSGRRGVNVLIHGEPGTGKTQLAAVLAQRLDATLYELALTGRRGQPIRGQDRLGSYRLAQALLASAPQSLLVFDEVEDVFRPPSDEDKGGLGIKAWLNQCLESNPVPAFWISNRVSDMDPAYLRRFDMVLELNRPPLAARRDMLREQTAALNLPAAWLETVAHAPGWSPAQLSRAVHVVQSLGVGDAGTGDAQPALTHLLNGSLNAMGLPLLKTDGKEPEDEDYLLEYANTDQPLELLLDGLQRRGRARLLFHGPPGTGKSGLARHLARELDLPLQIEQASSLLSAYVGETERNLAKAFERAEERGALLLIDEIDSLLQQRQSAVRNWEVSQVNELLLQLERFSGVFVATTNRLQALDPAALRRFDLKLGFAPLREPQVLVFLEGLAEACGFCPQALQALALQRRAELADLTVGDFRAYADQCELIRPTTPEALLEGLQAAAPHREAARPRIGFAA